MSQRKLRELKKLNILSNIPLVLVHRAKEDWNISLNGKIVIKLTWY
jgi:hypothetical protein